MFTCIHIPDFPVAAVVRATPELHDSAVVVVEGEAPLLRVMSMNEKARQAGIEQGMTAMQAEERLVLALGPQAANREKSKLTSKSFPWHIRQRSLSQEASAHAALLDCACAFSPRVEETATDTAIVDIAGLERLFGAPAQIARNLACRCTEAGLESNIAVAINPDTAMCAAYGFSGITILEAGTEAERLGALPIDVLLAFPLPQAESVKKKRKQYAIAELTATEMLETLQRWGVRTLCALASLPEVALAERLGQRGLYWRRLACGVARRELVIAQPSQVFEEAVELEFPIDLLEPLAFVLNRMLEQLCARLSARALATNELRLRLELDPEMEIDREGTPLEVCSTADQAEEQSQPQIRSLKPASDDKDNELCDTAEAVLLPSRRTTRFHAGAESRDPAHVRQKFHERTLRLPVPMLDCKTFLKLMQLDLQQHPPSAPVLKLWLAAEPVRPRAAQHGLFLPVAPQPERLELTLARMTRVAGGRERVGSPELLNTYRPDAFRMRHFSPPSPECDQPMQRVTRPVIAALRRFRPAVPVSVKLRHGVPARIDSIRRLRQTGLSREIRGKVMWAAGPWRSSGEWWAEARWEREEWDVAVNCQLPVGNYQALQRSDGTVAVYRIYRDAISDSWFVDAEYD